MYNPEFDKDKNQGVKPAPYADAAVNDEELTPPGTAENDLDDDEDGLAGEDELIDEDDIQGDEEPADYIVEEIDFEEIEIEDAGDTGEEPDPEEE